MKYYQIRNIRLAEAYAYDKKKKELKDGKKNETDNKERCEANTTTAKL